MRRIKSYINMLVQIVAIAQVESSNDKILKPM
jgi:hypothetical protein